MRFSRILRAAAGGGHSAGVHSAGGFAAPHVSQTHKAIGTTLGAIMWFWIFYKAREDGPVLLGMRKPWEHGHDDHHSEEAAHGEHGHEEEMH